MSDVDAQYERIVRMIPVDALQSSYNSLIQEGISSVNNAVDGVVAALSHLKEVRDAVDKLGQDKPQKNNNLLNTMEKTMALQRELKSVLQKMIQVENTTNSNVNRLRGVSKRMAKYSADKPIASRGGSEELRKREGELQNENQKRIRLSTGNAHSAGTVRMLNLLPSVEKMKTPLRPVEVVDRSEQNSATDTLKTSEDYLQMMRKLATMSAIDRYAHIREVLVEIADVVDKYGRTRVQEEHAVTFVKIVNLWPLRDNTDQKSLMDVYQRFLKAMETYQDQMVDTKNRDKLKWSIDVLAWVLKGLESRVSKEQLKGTVTGTQIQLPVVKAAKSLPSTLSEKRSSHRLGGNCLEKLRMMTQMSVAERRHQLPDVLAKLTDIVVVSKKQEQLSMLKYVLLWATLSAGKGDDMKAYDRFCKDMTAIISRSPEGGRKAGLERLNNSLVSVLKEHRTKNTVSISYDVMVFRVNAMTPGEKMKHIPEVFISLKKEMARGAGATNILEILNALRAVKQWAKDVPEESTLRQLYGDLAEQIVLYNRGVSMNYAKVSLTSEIHNFREISGIRHPEITVDQVLAKVKLLSGTSEAQRLLQLDECICMLGKSLRTCERKWPAAAGESYDLLLKYLEPYSPQFRNQRITTLNKWMYRHSPGLR